MPGDAPLTDGRRILVVDDNPGDIDLIRDSFEEHGVELAVARDGMSCLSLLYDSTRRPPDLVLLDLRMPGMNGREVLQQIKDDPVLRCIPVIVLSSSASPDDVRHAYAKHANGYVRKPFDVEGFERVARSVVDFWFDNSLLPSRAAR